MTTDKFQKLLPISGIVSAVLLVVAIVLPGSTPQVSATNHTDVVAFYTEHQDTLFLANILGLLSMFFFAPLLTALRGTLRSGEAGESIYSTLTLIGGVVVMGGTAIMCFAGCAAAGAAEVKLGAQSILTIALVNDYTWVPWLLGMALLTWAVGLGALRTTTLPKALGWVSVVLGALCLTGMGGIAVFFVSPLWVLALSIVLLRRQSAGSPAAAAVPAVS